MATITRFCLVGRLNLPQACGALYTSKRHSSSDLATIKKTVTLQNYKRGRGGRSSFSGIVATVFGASGFVGKFIVNGLGKIGSQVIIPYRGEEYDVDRLKILGDVGQILFQPYHLRDEESLRKCMQYSNLVINLIGRNFETKNFKYEDIYIDGPRRIARIAKELGVERFIHFSHLNCENPQRRRVFLPKTGSRYLLSKLEGEKAVREEFPEAIIFRPSDIVGENDSFHQIYSHKFRLNQERYVEIWKKGNETIKMPVLVNDVRAGVMEAITNPDVVGKTIDIFGPETFTVNELMKMMFLYRGEQFGHILGCSPKFSPLVWKARIMSLKYNPWNPVFTLDKLERDIISDIQTKGNLTLEDLGVFPTSVKPFLRQQLRIRDHSYIMPQHYRATRSDETSRPLLGVPFFILMFMFIYASRNTYSTRLKKPEKEQ